MSEFAPLHPEPAPEQTTLNEHQSLGIEHNYVDSNSFISDEQFNEYRNSLRNDILYLETMKGNGFSISDNDRNELSRKKNELEYADNIYENEGKKFITFEVTNKNLQEGNPELFKAPPERFSQEPESDEDIQNFTFDTAKEKLEKLPMLQGFPRKLAETEDKVTFNAKDEKFRIPVGRIIHASGFFKHNNDLNFSTYAWSGRDEGYGSKGKVRSLDTTIKYAKMGPLPGSKAVHSLYVVTDETGEVFYLTTNDNHRIAAAKLRGDQTIPVSSLVVKDPQVAIIKSGSIRP